MFGYVRNFSYLCRILIINKGIMVKYYSSYKHLLKKEKELGVKAPEELSLTFFGTGEIEINKEVADHYGEWTYSK